MTKAWVRIAKADATSANCANAAGRATAIHAAMPRCAPASGNTACSAATSSARISASLAEFGKH